MARRKRRRKGRMGRGRGRTIERQKREEGKKRGKEWNTERMRGARSGWTTR